MRTIADVREEIMRELRTDVSSDTIRRDQELGFFDVKRAKRNEYRVFDDQDVSTIRFVTLLRGVGIPRERIKEVLEGDSGLAWEAVNKLENIVLPKLKDYLLANVK